LLAINAIGGCWFGKKTALDRINAEYMMQQRPNGALITASLQILLNKNMQYSSDLSAKNGERSHIRGWRCWHQDAGIK
jgi:hypothetical protein